MTDIRFYYDGKLGNPPLEWKGIEVELNFEDANEIAVAITAEKFTFTNEIADLLNNYIAQGTEGGLGIYWGFPFRIELGTQILFDGYIDLVNEAEFSCEKVIAKVREAKKLDWIEEIADGFSFDGLYAKGFVIDTDFIKVPYIASEIPDYRDFSLYLIYAYVMQKELRDIFVQLQTIFSDLAGTFSTIAGVLKLIFYLAYLGFILAAFIKLLGEILGALVQPVKYHLGMLYKTHFEKACSYLGLEFKSSLFQDIPSDTFDRFGNEIPSAYWENECLIPEKRKEGFKKNKSTDQKGFYDGTFGDFIRLCSEKFNAKFTIVDKTFRFERVDYGDSTEVYKIPNVRRDFYGTNADQLVSNYLVQFQIDNLDLNTVNRYNGTNAKNFITSKIEDDSKASLIRGFKQPNILTARGYRKDELTRIESLLQGLFKILDAALNPIFDLIETIKKGIIDVISAINAVIDVINVLLPTDKEINNLTVPSGSVNRPNLESIITNRIGMLALSSDFIGITKSVMIEGDGWNVKVTADNETKLSAENLWNKCHFIESMVPSESKPAGNQMLIFNLPTIPFCLEDYYKIRGVNNENKGQAKVISPEGNPSKILSVKWNIYKNKATMKYAEERLFTDNLQEELLINTGS